MWMYDFNLFYEAGQLVLKGQSPYSIFDFNPPFPFALLAVPFALFPKEIAYLLYVLLVLFVLFKVMGKRGFIALLSFPVLFSLFVGQVDLVLAQATLLLGPWSLGLLIVKPQVAFIVAPWFIRQSNWKSLLNAGAAAGVLILVSFLIRPTWFVEWRARTPSLASYAIRDSSLYYLIADKNLVASILIVVSLIVAVLALFIRQRQVSWSFTSLFAPLSNIYSVSVLAEWFGWTEVVLSWVIMFALGGNIHNGAPMFIISLSILIKSRFVKQADQKPVVLEST